jgi:hypothetical protein
MESPGEKSTLMSLEWNKRRFLEALKDERESNLRDKVKQDNSTALFEGLFRTASIEGEYRCLLANPDTLSRKRKGQR